MRFLWNYLVLIFLVSCSSEERSEFDGATTEPPEREETDIVCPVHQVAVFKVHASYAISEPVWDPQAGLTIEQIRNRFPFAVWDSNLHQLDETKNAKFPRYNLVCDRCQSSWFDYASAHTPHQQRATLEVHISKSGEIRIENIQFDAGQITAIAKSVAMINPEARVHLRIHKDTPTDLIRPIVRAVEAGGIKSILFGSDVADRHSSP